MYPIGPAAEGLAVIGRDNSFDWVPRLAISHVQTSSNGLPGHV